MAEGINACRIKEKLHGIACQDAALPGDPDGLCILHSQDKGKDPGGFKAALLSRWNRVGLEFYDFQGFFSPGPFHPQEFFKTKEFTKPINFSRAFFTEVADFSEAIFKEWADFSRSSFTEVADFSGAIIGGRLVFQRINHADQEGRALPFEGDFSSLEFQEKGGLGFRDMSLAHVKFKRTDLRHPEFHHVTWHRLRGGRQALFDEVLLTQEELSLAKKILIFTGLVKPPEKPTPIEDDYAEVERLYRNLQVNYESVNDYKSSGDFHYGELEMHRRASKWRWFPLYWYNLYKLSSGYGERPLRAVLTLAGLLLAFSILFLGLESGLESLDGWNSGGLWDSFLYVFQQGTLQKPNWLKPATGGGKFLSALMPILIPGQTALFLLALRNRLGRRR